MNIWLNNKDNNMMDEEIDTTNNVPMISSITENKPRVYFNSVTGEIMKDNDDERNMYEIDEDDQKEQYESQIDQYTDVSSQDKRFFKLWNQFIIPK